MNNWTSMSDSAPEADQRVLIAIRHDYDIDEHVQIGIFGGSDDMNRFSLGYVVLDDEVTHWMKLPSIPGNA